jgi:hypothetical protein
MKMERAIRAQCSEHVILQVHDAVYAPLKRATRQVHDAIDASLQQALGGEHSPPHARGAAEALAELRRLLETGVRERELQDALVGSGLLALTCRVIQEVKMEATDDHRGMRMDLVLGSAVEIPAQVVELKRGSHLLLARRGSPSERLSRALTRAVSQLQQYGDRLETDVEAVTSIEHRYGVKIQRPELRLIAGRRLPDAQDYHLLSTAESTADDAQLALQIYTWDGLLAELERVAD